MKKIIFTVLIASLGFSTMAQNVNIPDANFKAALLAHDPVIDTDADGEISQEEAVAYSGSIVVSQMEISDLTGIEAFVSITELHCQRNELTSLDVGSNTALEALECWNNNMVAIDVSDLLSINYLNVGGNSIKDLDVSNNLVLTDLMCAGNRLETLDVSKNTMLIDLWVYENRLKTLDVGSNLVLDNLDCSLNELTTIDLSKNTELVSFNGKLNTFTEIDLSNNVGLMSINVKGNLLTTLDVSKNTALISLKCDDNLLTSIDLGLNFDLVSLSSQNNQITKLDILSNVRVRNLNISDNFLTAVDFSNSARLRELIINNNQIKVLDLSLNDGLKELSCTGNQLNTLNIKNGSNDILTEVDATGNPDLYCFQVDDPTAFQMQFPSSSDNFAFTSEECAQVSSITVSGLDDATSILSEGGTLQMSARITPNNATAKSVYWSVDNPELATIDADGMMTGISEGTVKVIATAKDATAITGETVIELNFIITALQDKEHSPVISVYPNPTTKNWVMIEGLSIESTQAQILAMNGQVLQSEILTAHHKISIANLKSGMYMLHIINSKINTTTKFVIE